MSLFRAKISDARSPIIHGLSNIIPSDSGISEPPLTEFGLLRTYLGRTQYFTTATYSQEQVVCMTARGLSGECIIMRESGGATDMVVKKIDWNGNEIWQADGTGISTTQQIQGGVHLSNDGSVLFGLIDGDDTTYGGPNLGLIPVEFNPDTGAIVDVPWVAPSFNGSAYGSRSIAYSAVHDEVAFATSNIGGVVPGLQVVGRDGTDYSYGTQPGGVSYQAVGWSEDGTYFFAMGSNGFLYYWARATFSGPEAAHGTIDLTTEFGTVLGSSIQNPTIEGDRRGDGVWICGGGASTPGDAYIIHITVESGTPVKDITVNVTSVWGIQNPSSDDCVFDISVDKFGDVYALCSNGSSGLPSSILEIDVCRFTSTGTFVWSMLADGTRLPIGNTESGAVSIAVCDAGYLYIGDHDGYVYAYLQSTTVVLPVVPDVPSFWTYSWRTAQGLPYTDGENVAIFGNDNGTETPFLQKASTSRPIYRTTKARNGIPSIEFVTTDYMDAALTLSQPATIAMVIEAVTDPSLGVLFDGVGANRMHVYTNGPDWIMYAGTNQTLSGSGDWNVGNTSLLVAAFDGASSYLEIDGTQYTPGGTVGALGVTTLRIAANNTGASGGGFMLHDVAVLNGKADAGQLAEHLAYSRAAYDSL